MQDKNNPLKVQGLDYPIASNLLKLQTYQPNLKLSQILLFEWLIVKSKLFYYQEFFYSFRRISEEIHLQKTALASASKLLRSTGFYSYEKKGMPKTTYHRIDFDKLATKKVLRQIYKAEYLDDVLPFFVEMKQQAKKHLKAKKTKEKKKRQKESMRNVNEIVEQLNETYNYRRQMYNDGELTGKKPDKILSRTQIPVNGQQRKILAELNQLYDTNSINNAFISFVDAMLQNEQIADNPISMFLTYDASLQAFKVFEYHLNHFNNNYSRSAA